MPRLINAATGETILEQLEIADTFWKRFKGLQFRRVLSRSTGLWLAPCSSLHTCFMRFPIDVIHLNRENCVLTVSRNVLPWRLHFCPRGTTSVIETMPEAAICAAKDRVELR